MGVDAMMLVRGIRKGSITQEQLDEKSYLFASMFTDDVWHRGGDHPGKALEFTDEFECDDPDQPMLVPEPNELFIKVNLMCRYYGEGYERGPALTIINMAEFLEYLLPEGQVFYGGDSSGTSYGLLDAGGRRAMKTHFFLNQRFPYINNSYKTDAPMQCSFDRQPMTASGWGGDLTYYFCSACPERVIARGSQVLKRVNKRNDEDSCFKLFEEVRAEGL